MARILVIDDDASLLQMMSLMLKRAGHTPILANDGLEGIEVTRQQSPDMVIVDVMMPDMSGYEVCRILRSDEETQNIPLLILTALSQPEQREWAEDSGADDFVTKPVTRDDLVKHVDELLSTGARNRPVPLESPPAIPAPGPARPAMPQPPAPPPVVSQSQAPAAPPGFEELFGTQGAQPAPPRQPPAPQPPAPQQQAPQQQAPAAPLGFEELFGTQGAQPAPAPVPVPAPTPAPAPAALPLIAVLGLSSGVGATTLAVNLGLGMMQFGRSCIVDLSTQGGQVAVQMRVVPPRATWADLARVEPGSDKRIIGGTLMIGHQAGVAILAAPLEPVRERLSGETLEYVYEVLSEGFQRIVVDLPQGLSAMTILTLREARDIVLVVGDNAADLMAAADTLATIEQLGLSGQQHLVLSRTTASGSTTEDVMAALNRPLAATIPFEAQQALAVGQGMPLVMSQPDSLYSRTVLQLARQL